MGWHENNKRGKEKESEKSKRKRLADNETVKELLDAWH